MSIVTLKRIKELQWQFVEATKRHEDTTAILAELRNIQGELKEVNMTEPIELARQGYQKAAREQQTSKRATKPMIARVAQELHGYGELLMSPPDKEEARYLNRDIQTLLQDLEHADKGMQVIPRIEQSIGQIKGDMYSAVADQKPDKYNNLKLSLEREEKALGGVKQQVKDIMRGADAYYKNSPEEVARSNEMLKTLRKELSAQYTYQDAKDGLPTHTKPVTDWLRDLKDRGAMDDRILARNVLKGGGVDYGTMLNDAERQGLSLTERAVAEMRDAEAGKPSHTETASTKSEG